LSKNRAAQALARRDKCSQDENKERFETKLKKVAKSEAVTTAS
jgi:hypothetical protein